MGFPGPPGFPLVGHGLAVPVRAAVMGFEFDPPFAVLATHDLGGPS